jgi:hypothetical protein
MPDFQYFAVYETPHTTVTRPETIVRLVRGEARRSAEALSRDGSWHPSDVLDEVFLGLTYEDVTVIGVDTARSIVADWHARGLVPVVPEDLRVLS